MHYENVCKASFVERKNRFIACVKLRGLETIVHVKNTGRCKELLLPGVTVYLQKSDNPARKTQYDLIAVEKGDRLINIDAQAPNQVMQEWLRAGYLVPNLKNLKPEAVFGASRLDFYWESVDGKAGFIEVKGATLEENGAVYFPDAPTERGVKHIEELIRAKESGYEATLCFVIQMEGALFLSPNDVTHPAFGAALRRAKKAGVRMIAHDCVVTPESMVVRSEVPIYL